MMHLIFKTYKDVNKKGFGLSKSPSLFDTIFYEEKLYTGIISFETPEDGHWPNLNFIDGVLNSVDDEPAAWDSDYTNMRWFKDGHLHRNCGPAVLSIDYIKFYLHGSNIQFDEWLSQSSASIEEKALLKLRYG